MKNNIKKLIANTVNTLDEDVMEPTVDTEEVLKGFYKAVVEDIKESFSSVDDRTMFNPKEIIERIRIHYG